MFTTIRDMSQAMDEGINEDPIQRYRFRFAGDDWVLIVEMWAEPGGGGIVEHIHPHHEERFEILDGEVTFTVEGRKRRAGPGDRVVAAPGVRHAFENTG